MRRINRRDGMGSIVAKINSMLPFEKVIANTGSVNLDLNENGLLRVTDGQLTGNLTLIPENGLIGVEQELTFKANGTATVTITGATLEGGGSFRNVTGAVNKLWIRVGQNENGILTYYYLWA